MVDELKAIDAVQSWVESFVVGLNVCPFARREVIKQRVRYSVTAATDRQTLTKALEAELLCMQSDSAIETCLLIHPDVLNNFYDYNDYLVTANTLVFQLGLEGIFQIASFHPEYQFAGTDADAAENYTNRSPYPILHILREDSLSVAIDNHPNIETIPEANIQLMNELGAAKLKQMLQACTSPATTKS